MKYLAFWDQITLASNTPSPPKYFIPFKIKPGGTFLLVTRTDDNNTILFLCEGFVAALHADKILIIPTLSTAFGVFPPSHSLVGNAVVPVHI